MIIGYNKVIKVKAGKERHEVGIADRATAGTLKNYLVHVPDGAPLLDIIEEEEGFVLCFDEVEGGEER